MENNRILVVDDNLGIHADFRKILMPSLPPGPNLMALESDLFGGEAAEVQGVTRIRYELDCAGYAADGLRLFLAAQAEGRPYSVVFTDIRMPPGEDGVMLIERIWAVAPRTQVVIMTAFTDYSWEDLIARFGWSDRLIILRKPFDTITVKQLALMLTRRWFTEEALRARRDALVDLLAEKEVMKERLARFREVMDQAGDAVLMIESDTGRVEDFNTTFCRLLGYEAFEVEGMHVSKFLEPGRFEVWCDGATLEDHVKTRDGSRIPVEVSLRLQQPGKRKILSAMIRDISARVRAEQERRALESQLRHAQKMQTIGTLAGGIAHDFNNILSPILVYTEMAIEDTRNERIRSDMQQVHKAALRARDLVQHILAFSHQVEKDRVPLKLHLIVKEALHLVRASIPTTISMEREVPDCGLVLAGPTQVHQVLVNLCTNACHAMREQGGTLTIRLGRTLLDVDATRLGLIPGEYCVLSVRDTGTGMSTEVRRRIFEPFYTTKREGEGTGLGLSMVHDIVKAHNGAVEVRSEPGTGSVFRVYLPVATAEEEAGPDGPETPSGGREHVLLVDDEESLVRMTTELLHRYGYRVTGVTDPREALALFIAQPYAFDLVITDQTMPHMVGMALGEKLLAVRPDLPIILCTGFAEDLTEEAGLQAGMRAFLLKPLMARELAAAVDRALHPRTPSGDEG